jgi:hypothetical protein
MRPPDVHRKAAGPFGRDFAAVQEQKPLDDSAFTVLFRNIQSFEANP